jgi:hypothetical protein
MASAPNQTVSILDSHTAVRYCKPSSLDLATKQLTGACVARKSHKKTLSVNDLDLAPGDTAAQRLAATKGLMLIGLRPSGKLASLPVAAIRSVRTVPPLDVIYDPVEMGGLRNDAHCGVTNVPTGSDPLNSVLLALKEAVTAASIVGDI